jgi:uncharacterized protein YndB with AHSA1/START domain
MTSATLNPVLEVRRVFETTPEALVDAGFTREQWQAWIGPEGCQCEVPILEPKLGGRYSIKMNLSDGRVIPVEGVFQTVNRPHGLSFTWGWALSGKGDTLVRLSFRAVPGGTELILTHEGLPTPADREDHGKGWNSVFNKLARFVKGETP